MAQASPELPPRPRVWIHVLLLLLTVATTTVQGYLLSNGTSGDPARIGSAFAFSGTLLGILLSHELGHYVFARIHRIDTTLPFVIPAPPGFTLGTLGAVIRMRSPMSTRDALIDVGASGPIVGAIVALPLLVVGLRMSTIVASPTGQSSFWFGHETLWTVLSDAFHKLQSGAVPPPPSGSAEAFGDNLLMRLATWLVFPKIPQGSDVLVHPVAIAAWFGLLVTSLNLFPIGQLDGGHVSYAVLGPRGHKWLGEIVSAGLLVLAFVSSLSWTLWWVVTRFALGLSHPPLERGEQSKVSIGPLRAAIAVLALLLFVATFVPVPLDRM